MGANPVSMNWGEALSAFQQGTVDGQENPIVSVIIPNKLWQVHKYATIWNYAIDPLILSVSKETWDSFTAQDRDAIKKAADEVAKWQKSGARQGLEGSTAAIDTLKKNGMEVTVLTPKEIGVFKTKTKAVHDKWKKEIGAELIDLAEKDIQKSAAKK
jgi:TRAP-type transport system periplasmic protein